MIYFFPFFSFWVKDFLEPLKGSQAAVQSPLQSKESMQGSSHPMALPDLSVSVNRVVLNCLITNQVAAVFTSVKF